MPEWSGEERRAGSQIMEHRLTKLEEAQRFTTATLDSLKAEVSSFRHDLFKLLNPALEKIGNHDSEIKAIEDDIQKINVLVKRGIYIASIFVLLLLGMDKLNFLTILLKILGL